MTRNAFHPSDLPDHLTERISVLRDGPLDAGKPYVLCWIHHAIRDHENPALDVAVFLGNTIQRPVLVYQGLGGSHPYNADRHHVFIMEGARDVQQGLARRGIAYRFHLPEIPEEPGPLRKLAHDAAIVITETFPAPPFPHWTAALADRIAAPLWTVDCSCIVPMATVGRRFERAFQFRKHTRQAFDVRLTRPWQDQAPEVDPFTAALSFESLDLQAADLQALSARCRIDHGIGPVPHTRGGSRAGYARWEAFKRDGLRAYARLRNDAAVIPPRGVSRLSPYLHYGMVSPLRIAREAAADGSAGAEKFLDELLIWRELAHNFCFHTPDPENLASLPDWARETLARHGEDPRPVLYTAEQLERARTGEPLWDAAQRSLLRHGELHNNLRMTWGKALLAWTPSPAEALQRLAPGHTKVVVQLAMVHKRTLGRVPERLSRAGPFELLRRIEHRAGVFAVTGERLPSPIRQTGQVFRIRCVKAEIMGQLAPDQQFVQKLLGARRAVGSRLARYPQG